MYTAPSLLMSGQRLACGFMSGVLSRQRLACCCCSWAAVPVPAYASLWIPADTSIDASWKWIPGSQTAHLKLGWACQTALKRGCEAECSVSPICFSVVVQLLSHVWLFVTLWTQHARFLCPSLSPWVCSDSCSLSWWCHPTILSSVIPFSSCFSLFQHQALFQQVGFLHQMAKVLEL